MGLAIYEIVWYIKYALGAYSINPPNLFCMLTGRGGHMTALFVSNRMGMAHLDTVCIKL